LQEINIAFGLGLAPKDVKISAINKSLPDASKTKEILARLHSDKRGWFWTLREYRNHSAHRNIIFRHITLIMDGSSPRVFLVKYPLDPDKGHSDKEIIKYCSDSLNNVKEIIDRIYKQCQIELSERT
jgi:hypothetical protein